MTYFTTMNLPAPEHSHFREKLAQYWGKPWHAMADFEDALKEFFDVPHVSTWSNCFTAIAMSLIHATRWREKNVAIAAMAYRRTADIVLWAGLTPVFVDNDPDTLAMDLNALRSLLEKQSIGCILFQHPMVHIADVQAVQTLAAEFDVPLIFDSVEATGGKYASTRIGRCGLAEAFSLHPSKVINAAEGGILTFGSSAAYGSFMQSMNELGLIDSCHGHQRMALEPVHAIMGLASLEIYAQVTTKHQSHYEQYEHELNQSKMLELIGYNSENEPNYKSILVRFKSTYASHRQALMAYLETQQIGARAYYAPLHHLAQYACAPHAHRMAQNYMILPIGHSVNEAAIEQICTRILCYEQQHVESSHA